MDVPDGEEDADAAAGAAVEGLIGDFKDAAIGGRDDGVGVGWDLALRIAKEPKDESAQREKEYRQNVLADEPSDDWPG